ncbi:MAG: hypothetical protein C0475_00220 [Planctomyces sp.]|nr:hypothetical protein [Planctomyces sp.]MBA4119353.1 hypothetical protein [Isosphaera sp.]
MTGRVRLGAAVLLALALGVLVLPAVRGGSSEGLSILVQRGREPKPPLPVWAPAGDVYDEATFSLSIDAVAPAVPPRPVTNVPAVVPEVAQGGQTSPADAGESPAPDAPAVASKWEMIGAIVGPEFRRAILRRDRAARQVMVGEGETIEGGFEVLRIEDRRVVVRTAEGVEESLVLRGSAPPAAQAQRGAALDPGQRWTSDNAQRLSTPPRPSPTQPRVRRDSRGRLVQPPPAVPGSLPVPNPAAPSEEPGEER